MNCSLFFTQILGNGDRKKENQMIHSKCCSGWMKNGNEILCYGKSSRSVGIVGKRLWVNLSSLIRAVDKVDGKEVGGKDCKTLSILYNEYMNMYFKSIQ